MHVASTSQNYSVLGQRSIVKTSEGISTLLYQLVCLTFTQVNIFSCNFSGLTPSKSRPTCSNCVTERSYGRNSYDPSKVWFDIIQTKWLVPCCRNGPMTHTFTHCVLLVQFLGQYRNKTFEEVWRIYNFNIETRHLRKFGEYIVSI
jgi:hypothetical protein